MQILKDTEGYLLLIAAVVERAIADLREAGRRGIGKKEPDRAMAFILSDVCEGYCLYLGIDYDLVREKAAELYRKITPQETVIRANGQPRRYAQHAAQLPSVHSLSTGKPKRATNSRKSL